MGMMVIMQHYEDDAEKKEKKDDANKEDESHMSLRRMRTRMLMKRMPAASALGSTARSISRALTHQQDLQYLNIEVWGPPGKDFKGMHDVERHRTRR